MPRSPVLSDRATTFDLHDQLGSAVKQTNSSAGVSATRTYDAFGMLVTSTGTPQGPFGFAGSSGYQEDGDTGLKLLGHRYYDSSTGRFLTRDPAKDGRNWYGYCGNDPLRGLDPTGYSFWGWGDDRWTDFSEWWSGTDVTDKNGSPVRVGGWPALLMDADNAITVNGTIHVNDGDEYENNYINNSWKQDHESYHIVQYEAIGAAAFWYEVIAEYDSTYLTGGGHDQVPLEIEANNYASNRPLGDPYTGYILHGEWDPGKAETRYPYPYESPHR